MLDGLAAINIEITNRCNKSCWMCGRRKLDKLKPGEIEYGEMSFDMLKDIAKQLPSGIVVQLHNNGEPLMYSRFGEAVELFQNQIVSVTTNGKLLVEKADEIIGKLDTVAISVFQGDLEKNEQYKIIKEFVKLKGKNKPSLVIRLLGNVLAFPYQKFGIIATRILHEPMGSFNYEKKTTVPEVGICQDLLHHPAINYKGDFSLCVRFDPERKGVLGNVKEHSLESLWKGKVRSKWIECHLRNERNKVPLCAKCDFWGVPTGRN